MKTLCGVSADNRVLVGGFQVVHFEDFERAVYPFLRQKIIESQKISEAVLHNTFKVGRGWLGDYSLFVLLGVVTRD